MTLTLEAAPAAKETLIDALVAYGEACYAFLPPARTHNGLVFRVHHSLIGYSRFLVSSWPLAQVRAESNHRAMEAAAFEAARLKDMEHIISLARQLRPDLFSKDFSFALDLHGTRPEGKPRFQIEIDGHPVRERIAAAKKIIPSFAGFVRPNNVP